MLISTLIAILFTLSNSAFAEDPVGFVDFGGSYRLRNITEDCVFTDQRARDAVTFPSASGGFTLEPGKIFHVRLEDCTRYDQCKVLIVSGYSEDGVFEWPLRDWDGHQDVEWRDNGVFVKEKGWRSSEDSNTRIRSFRHVNDRWFIRLVDNGHLEAGYKRKHHTWYGKTLLEDGGACVFERVASAD